MDSICDMLSIIELTGQQKKNVYANNNMLTI